MDIVVICNGLGNQMSQYAFYLQKKKINKATRFLLDKKSRNDHNGYELGHLFGIQYSEKLFDKFLYILFRILGIKKYPFWSKKIVRFFNFFGLKIIDENYNYDFDKKNLNPRRGLNFYYGGWHNEEYFSVIKNVIQQKFCFNPILDDANLLLINQIKEVNSVSIHVRRGDYLSAQNYNLFGDVCTKEYFERAIEFIKSNVFQPHFFIFSNDIDWVKFNIKTEKIIYIDCNKKDKAWMDMYLMSICKHNIIANSSFSWWGAWLNGNVDKFVVCPCKFLKNDESSNIYPASWIRINTN